MCLSLKPALSSSWCWARCGATPLPLTSTWWPQRACSTWPLRTWQRLCPSVCSAPPSPSCCVPWRPCPNTRRSANVSDYRSASSLMCHWAVNYWILVSFHCHKPYAGVDCAGFSPPALVCFGNLWTLSLSPGAKELPAGSLQRIHSSRCPFWQVSLPSNSYAMSVNPRSSQNNQCTNGAGCFL